MTFLRRLAVGCAAFLEKHASPGWKEWAGGLRRETDFIESDWQALQWACSGLWTLLDYRPTPIRSLEDLAVASAKFANKQRYKVNDVWFARNMTWLIWAMQIFSSSLSFLISRSHAGLLPAFLLKVAGMSILLVHGVMNSGEPDVPDRDDRRGMVLFYKASTERFCKRAAPVWLLGTVLVSLGYAFSPTKWERAIPLAMWGVLPLVVVWMWFIHYRRFRDIEKFNLSALGDL